MAFCVADLRGTAACDAFSGSDRDASDVRRGDGEHPGLSRAVARGSCRGRSTTRLSAARSTTSPRLWPRRSRAAKLLLAGNGGSAGDAQHLAGEMVSRLNYDRAPAAAIALTTDSSVLTAIGNDYSL
jgi:hypothetical protein